MTSWFVPRRTYEIAQENAKKMNEQRIKVSQENKELQLNLVLVSEELEKAKKEIASLKRKLKKATGATEEKSKKATKKTPKKEAK